MDYDYGRGGKAKDLAEANKWYRKAAERGNVTACFALGVNYEYGRGVPKNWKSARGWYEKAMRSGHREAAFRYHFRHLNLPNGRRLRFFRHCGLVKSSMRGAETERAASNMVGHFSQGGKRRRKVRIRGGTFFLNSELGGTIPIELNRDPGLLLYAGQKVTLIYAMPEGVRSGPYMLIYNHDDNTEATLTSTRRFWDSQMMGASVLLIAVATIVAVLSSLLLGMSGWPRSEGLGALALLFHPFDWALFLPLAAVIGYWIHVVRRRRNEGLAALRRHMAEIRQWVRNSYRKGRSGRK